MAYELGPASIPEITDENVISDRARVRALVVHRSEMLWAPIGRRLEEDSDESRPIDPRLLEIGRALLKDLAGWYQLTKVTGPTEEEDDGLQLSLMDKAALVEQNLQELEQKLRRSEGKDPGPAAR